MNHKQNKEQEDFKSFMNSDVSSPSKLGQEILAHVEHDLSRLPWHTFAKSLGVHWIAGALTLLVCPQFGWNPFETSPHLPHIFMQYGMWACGLFCGTIFMALGSLLTMALLPAHQRLYVERHGFRFALVIGSLSIALLMLLGRGSSGFDIYMTESFISFWLVGAVLFDWAIFKGNKLMNRLQSL